MNRFTIIERDGCVIVEGLLHPRWITAICSIMPEETIISPQLAGMLGANFAFGMREDVDALIAAIAPRAEASAIQNMRHTGLSEAAMRWLASGHRGNSSETIFTHVTGIDANTGSKNSHPYDPSDLRRCRLLLEQCPEIAAKFADVMPKVSKAWAGLVRDWETICSTMDEETPEWRAGSGSATKTYQLIKAAIGKN